MFRVLTLLAIVLGCQAQSTDLVGCDEYAEVCYVCGCFNNTNTGPFYDRPLPQHPTQQELQFDLYTQQNPDDRIRIDWDDDVQVMINQLPDWYDNTLQTKFMVHGWVPRTPPQEFKYCPNDDFQDVDIDTDQDIIVIPQGRYGFTDIKNALLERYNYNVYIVQWREGAGFYNYGQSASNARSAGYCAGHFALLPEVTAAAEQVHCMGHSLGGQFCGYMGTFTGGTMGRLTGLDPAGPAFDKNETYARIDRSDAGLVDNIYSNVNSTSGLITLGMGKPVGHKDFYPNGGGRQPQCNEFYCDHQAPTDYYYASIDTNCTFVSFPCDSWGDIDDGECITCEDGVDCQTMGYYVDQNPGEGTFYLETVADYPHCMASSQVP